MIEEAGWGSDKYHWHVPYVPLACPILPRCITSAHSMGNPAVVQPLWCGDVSQVGIVPRACMATMVLVGQVYETYDVGM